MFGWIRKQFDSKDTPRRSIDPALQEGVEAIVRLLRAEPFTDDEELARHLIGGGLSERQATKLIQFAPIAFTRFLYRSAGIQFAPDYVVLSAERQPIAQRAIDEEPAFREAWTHCEQAAASGKGDEYFSLVAARSGGYRAIQDLVAKGSDLSDVITGPPFMME